MSGRIAVALALLALFVSLVGSAFAGPNRTGDGRCFPRDVWSDSNDQSVSGGIVSDVDRPCVRVTRVFEDGSFRAVVSDASGRFRYRVSIGARDR